MNSAMIDSTNNRAFITSTEDPEVNVMMWFLPEQVRFFFLNNFCKGSVLHVRCNQRPMLF